MVYSVNPDSYSKTVHDQKVREHGNSKQKRPYYLPHRPYKIKTPGYDFEC